MSFKLNVLFKTDCMLKPLQWQFAFNKTIFLTSLHPSLLLSYNKLKLNKDELNGE